MRALLQFVVILAGWLAVFMLPASADKADIEKGKRAFAKCQVCHSIDGKNLLGPTLKGIIGRPAGSVEGFRYSRALKNAKIIWDEKTLDAYIDNPQQVAPGTTMPFSGIADPGERADVIAYLRSLN